MRKICVTSFFLAGMLFSSAVSADDHNGVKTLPVVTNGTYLKNCGSCHFAYQPGLLPARSWQKIIGKDGHPGGPLSLDKRDRAEINNYLERNGAEKSSAKRSRKILASIGSDTPVRISETPYIKEKHHEISRDAFTRKSVGSRANCAACHKSAAQGVYEDDDVVIPK